MSPLLFPSEQWALLLLFPLPFPLVSNFLTVPSGFYSHLSLSSLLPRWAHCCSLAVAIEITPLSLPLLFSCAPLAEPAASSQMCQPALLLATWAGCPAECWAEYPCPGQMPEPLYCTSGSQEVALIGALNLQVILWQDWTQSSYCALKSRVTVGHMRLDANSGCFP